MFARLLTVLLLLPAAAAAQMPDDHPYKGVKVGDYAKYKNTALFGGPAAESLVTMTVTATTDKEVTIRVESYRDGAKLHEREEKHDLTRPYDPIAALTQKEAPLVKLKEGKAKVRAGGRDYDTTWTTYQAVGKGKAAGTTAEITWWMSPAVPGGMVRSEVVTVRDGKRFAQTEELIETGRGQPK